MGIVIHIGSETRDFIDERWINDQLHRRGTDGPVCVQVSINTSAINVSLATPACAPGIGGSRPPTPAEREVLDLWNHHRLNTNSFTGGSLIAFLKQLRRVGIAA